MKERGGTLTSYICQDCGFTYDNSNPDLFQQKCPKCESLRILFFESISSDDLPLTKSKSYEIHERISRDEMFMAMAQIVSLRSSCKRNQVGAILVKNNRVISIGYNGPPAHINCETCQGPDCEISIHAEINSIVYAAKAGISIEGATLYCTLSPCLNCAKSIINSGIKKVVYNEQYRAKIGIQFLEDYGIEIQKFRGLGLKGLIKSQLALKPQKPQGQELSQEEIREREIDQQTCNRCIHYLSGGCGRYGCMLNVGPDHNGSPTHLRLTRCIANNDKEVTKYG